MIWVCTNKPLRKKVRKFTKNDLARIFDAVDEEKPFLIGYLIGKSGQGDEFANVYRFLIGIRGAMAVLASLVLGKRLKSIVKSFRVLKESWAEVYAMLIGAEVPAVTTIPLIEAAVGAVGSLLAAVGGTIGMIRATAAITLDWLDYVALGVESATDGAHNLFDAEEIMNQILEDNDDE